MVLGTQIKSAWSPTLEFTLVEEKEQSFRLWALDPPNPDHLGSDTGSVPYKLNDLRAVT